VSRRKCRAATFLNASKVAKVKETRTRQHSPIGILSEEDSDVLDLS